MGQYASDSQYVSSLEYSQTSIPHQRTTDASPMMCLVDR